MDMKHPGGHEEGRKHNAHGQAETPVVAEHQPDHPNQCEQTRQQLIRAPRHDAIQRVDVCVGPGDDPSLVGLVEIVCSKTAIRRSFMAPCPT